MNKRLLLTFHLFLFSCYTIYAQAPSWQWGIRGGSADTYTSGPDESVVDMATDSHGNIYVLSYVRQTALNVDGHSITAYGDRDILITSFKCDGTYRWAKDIGSNSTDYPIALKTDTLGGVYVTGALFCDAVTDHISTDTSWSATSFKTLFLLKYDTAGNYKWFRMPEPDTLTIWSTSSFVFDMDVDGGGNCYMLCNLQPGAFAGGAYVVATQGQYILKYDKNGNFVSGNPMQIAITGSSTNLVMKRNNNNGNYYITGSFGSGTLSFGGTPITHAVFIGCFNSAGTFLWQKQDVIYFGSTPRPGIDADGSIYLTNATANGDTLDGYAITNAPDDAPFVIKMDSSGTLVWGKNSTTNGASLSTALTLNGSEIDISGLCGKLIWPGFADSLNHDPLSGYQIFITRINTTTGAVIGLDSLVSTSGAAIDATAMTSDNFGNFYLGGDFAVSLTVNGTTLSSIGGNSDFFVAKYGTANCECVLPTASFTHTGTSAITFTYTGSTTYDSVRWNFGDGGTSAVVSPTHTYTTSGTYTACVIVYGACGNDTACQTITATTTGIASATSGLNNISIYPNPATGQLIIDNAAIGTTIRLFNIMGQQAYSGTVTGNRQVIDTRNLPNGNYIIQLTDANGNRMNRTVVKE